MESQVLQQYSDKWLNLCKIDRRIIIPLSKLNSKHVALFNRESYHFYDDSRELATCFILEELDSIKNLRISNSLYSTRFIYWIQKFEKDNLKIYDIGNSNQVVRYNQKEFIKKYIDLFISYNEDFNYNPTVIFPINKIDDLDVELQKLIIDYCRERLVNIVCFKDYLRTEIINQIWSMICSGLIINNGLILINDDISVELVTAKLTTNQLDKLNEISLDSVLGIKDLSLPIEFFCQNISEYMARTDLENINNKKDNIINVINLYSRLNIRVNAIHLNNRLNSRLEIELMDLIEYFKEDLDYLSSDIFNSVNIKVDLDKYDLCSVKKLSPDLYALFCRNVLEDNTNLIKIDFEILKMMKESGDLLHIDWNILCHVDRDNRKEIFSLFDYSDQDIEKMVVHLYNHLDDSFLGYIHTSGRFKSISKESIFLITQTDKFRRFPDGVIFSLIDRYNGNDSLNIDLIINFLISEKKFDLVNRLISRDDVFVSDYLIKKVIDI